MSFAAIRPDGKVDTWGAKWGNEPLDKGFERLVPGTRTFAGVKTDGSVYVWGDPSWGGNIQTKDKDFVDVVGLAVRFSGLKRDGSVVTWGGGPPCKVPDKILKGGCVTLFSAFYKMPYLVPRQQRYYKLKENKKSKIDFDVRGSGWVEFAISKGELPKGLELDKDLGFILGSPSGKGKYECQVQIKNEFGDNYTDIVILVD